MPRPGVTDKSPENTRLRHYADSTLGQRHRRWPNVESASAQRDCGLLSMIVSIITCMIICIIEEKGLTRAQCLANVGDIESAINWYQNEVFYFNSFIAARFAVNMSERVIIGEIQVSENYSYLFI